MKRQLLTAVAFLFLWAGTGCQQTEAGPDEVTLMEGTAYETQAFVVDSGREGPVVCVVAGIHGNELAGPATVIRLKDLEPESGKLILLPEANRPALEEEVRMLYSMGDLNRAFPGKAKGRDVDVLAGSIMTYLVQQSPDLVIDLHASTYHNEGTKYAYGASVIFQDPDLMTMVENGIDHLNSFAAKPYVYYFDSKEGTLTQALSSQGIPTLTFEADSDADMAIQVEEQYAYVLYMLEAVGVGISQ